MTTDNIFQQSDEIGIEARFEELLSVTNDVERFYSEVAILRFLETLK